MVRDGLVFKDENGQVIFNQYSFCELVKHLLVELVGISYEEASQTEERSPLAAPVSNVMEVVVFSHDLPYYHFDLDEIEHDPYVLISLLSALHEGEWTLSQVEGSLQMLFDRQYILTERVEVETRYDSDDEPYSWYICYVTLENKNLSHLPVSLLSEEQMSRYSIYMSTLGNRPDLFPDSPYVDKYITNPPEGYEVPGEYLDDETFAAIFSEAEKYIGYARKLAENINQSNLIDARVPSILIAGGSNFPVRKKEKQNAARDKNMGEYMQIEGLLDKVRSTGMGGISADDDRAVEKLEAKLAGLEAMQEEMKTVNAYYRKHKTLEGCSVLSAEEIGKLQSSMASDWRKNPVPYPSYLLTNNNANIRRTRQRIEDLKSQSEYAGWAFPGGRAEINEGENRLQLFFEEKPSEEQRRELKSNGFKWAPSQGAWQRQLTKNAIYAAGRMEFLRPEDGQSPYQLQPFARKTEKDMAR